MKSIHLLFSSDSLWIELMFSFLIVASFMALGYFAREFALDIQANFLGTDWGSF